MNRRVLTTGQVAKYCGVNFRTVIRWIERGDLPAYQLPGRGDNRIEVEDFLAFLRKHQMPIPGEFQLDGRRVLIMEKDRGTADQVAVHLRKAGFETVHGETGFRAGALLGLVSPSVVLALDLDMAGLGGLDALKALREHPKFADVKFVVLTGGSAEELDQMRQAGADRVLDRATSPDDLVRHLEALMVGPGDGVTAPIGQA